MGKDEEYMSRALELARRGLGRVSPNPAVGAVVTNGGEVVGEGWHDEFGGPHAEVRALKEAGEKAEGATLYLTLEPCSHHGKTPPCTNAILRAGITRVVAAARDPHATAKGGAEVLRDGGIEVELGVLEREAVELNRAFFKYLDSGLPYFTLKWAMTADGKAATRKGLSRWITSDGARGRARRMRADSDCVMVGAGTVLADDPLLSSRLEKEPRKLIVDDGLRTPPGAKLFRGGGDVLVACVEDAPKERAEALEGAGARILRVPRAEKGVDLTSLAQRLPEERILRVFAEGGPTLLGGLLNAGLADELVIFIAPKVFGGGLSATAGEGVASPSEALELEIVESERLGPDLMLRMRPKECSRG